MQYRPEPIRRFPLSPIDRFLERTCLVLLILSFGTAFIAFFFLPDQIVINYRGDRRDSQGSKMYVFLPILLSAFCYLLFYGISKYANVLRSPAAASEEARLRQYRRSIRIMRWFKLFLILSFSIELFETLRLTFRPSRGINGLAITIETVLVAIPVCYLLFALIRNFRRRVFTKN